MWKCLIVGAGGFVGASARYLLSLLPIAGKTQFPVVTLFINIAGAFLIGVLAGLAARQGGIGQNLSLFLQTGICGGFTTFSAFALETTNLASGGKTGMAVVYVLCSLLLGLLAVTAGRALIRP